jgi:TonB family protein
MFHLRISALLFVTVSAFGQAAKPTPPSPTGMPQAAVAPRAVDLPLPKDAKDILTLAVKTNGLGGDELKPWHIKASFETFDEKGKNPMKGTLNVYWASPTKYKRVYTSGDFNQVEYGTDHGRYHTGNPVPPPYPATIIVDQLLQPLPGQTEIDEFSPEKREETFGKVKLQCVMLSQKIVRLAFAPLGLFPTYCFAPEKPLLRVSSFSGGINIVYNKLVLFQERYLAREINIKDQLIPLANITLDEIGGIPLVRDSDFEPPNDAVKGYDNPVAVSSGVMAGNILRKVQPTYPPSALANRVSGTVTLEAVIGRDGRIHRLKVVTSPDPALSIAAIAAVQKWMYKPYTLAGQPVDVGTQIKVIFALGG